ncbi:hypothetical protein [Kribbella speibonae]|uniref:DUF3618 domain-containing protein n=1 Tax=Kribbella speibonae TaxID=1572660 RepID=A0ABY2AD06_9ACTN|nr:hypothetical protein [Kribbella speibonae]TCC26717.1 hypothetical protein E0H58_01425 [Kribbella speibonae]
MAEPTLSEVHADLVGRLKHDERLRAVETQTATLQAIVQDIPRMEARLTAAIQDSKPKNTAAWASVVVAVVAVVVALLAITGQ